MTEIPDISGLTAKRQKFVQAIMNGQGDVEAYRTAGYSQNMCPRDQAIKARDLKKNGHIAAILTNFQLRLAEKIDMSAEAHINRLMKLSNKANGLDQVNAAIRGEELIGRVSGHYVDRVAIERADPVQDALGVMIEEIERTLGAEAADEYARKKGVERLTARDTDIPEVEYVEVTDEGVTSE